MFQTGDRLLAQAITAEARSPTAQAPAIAIRTVMLRLNQGALYEARPTIAVKSPG